jgi:hypothetical protein
MDHKRAAQILKKARETLESVNAQRAEWERERAARAAPILEKARRLVYAEWREPVVPTRTVDDRGLIYKTHLNEPPQVTPAQAWEDDVQSRLLELAEIVGSEFDWQQKKMLAHVSSEIKRLDSEIAALRAELRSRNVTPLRGAHVA